VAWSAADSLRWVHAASAGVNHVLTPEVVASDVIVTNSRGVFDEPMAEYVLTMALALAKDLPTTPPEERSTGSPTRGGRRPREVPSPGRRRC
jgi:phosphoglycerate dehydrogenase-like enzyme